MIERQATLIVADDMYTSMSGKQTLQGIYTADINIPSNPSIAPQLVFYFIVETDINDPFQSVALEITFPDEPTQRIAVSLTIPPVLPDRTRTSFRVSALVPFPKLKPGHIIAKVIHEKGEILVMAPWISVMPQMVNPDKS
jgi:hypothetical protein